MAEHTHCVVGSTTKAFTAAGISVLVEDGERYPQIQWESPVHVIVSDDFVLSDDWCTTHVTISDALSHHTRLPRHNMFNTSSPRETVHKLRHLPVTDPIRRKMDVQQLDVHCHGPSDLFRYRTNTLRFSPHSHLGTGPGSRRHSSPSQKLEQLILN